MLVTCDGNDSLKRCVNAGAADLRVYESDYFIPQQQVNKFQDEVANSRGNKRQEEAYNPGATEASECEKRWKNASADTRPGGKPKAIFSETGVFVATCRHSFILTVCDMVNSGEQYVTLNQSTQVTYHYIYRAKYGLATIDKLISAFGSKILMGYDIGCTFKGTANRSALVGPLVRDSGFDMCVGSFHGPAHNRVCQTKNHPHCRPGAGLTDFENCETVFSSSNRVASTTRLASAYHRHQKIDHHFDAWDDDQYSNIGQ